MIKQEDKDKYSAMESVKTQTGSKTMALGHQDASAVLANSRVQSRCRRGTANDGCGHILGAGLETRDVT